MKTPTSIPNPKFRVLGYWWTVRLLTKRQYHKRNGKDSLACTKAWKRRIDLSPRGMDKETLCHEVVHAFLSEKLIWGLDLDAAHMEEVYCELLAKRGYEMLKLVDDLFLRLKLLSAKIR